MVFNEVVNLYNKQMVNLQIVFETIFAETHFSNVTVVLVFRENY